MIHIQDLSCRFGDKEILHNISLDIEEGGFYAILGANGCGKTTFLRCVSGLLEPSVGEVSLGREKRPLKAFSARELAQKISFVRQQASSDFEFSAFEIVLMGRNPYQRRMQNESQADKEIVERCMRQTNTFHLRNSKPHEMSGGELQRVMIARALAQSTPVMLLDEPTSNLDIAHQFEIMELLRDIREKEGKTILIVVHDLNLALQYCPQTILLHKGDIFQKGKTADVLTPENISTIFGVDAIRENNHLRFCHKDR